MPVKKIIFIKKFEFFDQKQANKNSLKFLFVEFPQMFLTFVEPTMWGKGLKFKLRKFNIKILTWKILIKNLPHC